MSNILLGVTGSVASILTPKLVKELQKLGEVKVVCTTPALDFIPENNEDYYTDSDEFESFKKIGDPILHIELRKWADLLLVAPCTANTIAKISCGLCDNLLTNIVRAWDFNKPFFIAPACNTYMWESQITNKQCQELHNLGIKILLPQKKTLACGDTGYGAMMNIEEIVEKVGARVYAIPN